LIKFLKSRWILIWEAVIEKISPILKADHRGPGNRTRESRPFHPDGLPLEFEVPMRARNIKPGFFDNETLAKLGPCGQILFEGLWCLADRDGRLENRPARIKVKISPYYEPFLGLTVNPPLNNGEPTVIERLIHQLTTLGFLTLYDVNGNQYIQIMNFLKHQRPHITEKQSQIPKIPEDLKITVDSTLDNVGNVPDSLIPDSLIPDSLIPDSLIPDLNTLSGEDAPTPHSEKSKPPVQEIMIYLVQKTGRKFDTNPVSKSNKRLIQARWNDGRTVEDFKTVIDNQCAKWKTDPKMIEYLRPETLFGTKFESYLTAIPNPLQGKVSSITIKNLETMKRWSAKQDAGQKKIYGTIDSAG
jgi:uncharacterized phage protein (TIGR02220 family)